MSHFNLRVNTLPRAALCCVSNGSWACCRDRMRKVRMRLTCVSIVLLLWMWSCIITGSRSSFFPFAYLFALAHFFHTQICILCMHKCGCFCVSHNSTTAGQRVQPCCSLSCHSVRWYTHLIHFALTPNSRTHSLCHAVSLQPDLCFKYGRFFVSQYKLKPLTHAQARVCWKRSNIRTPHRSVSLQMPFGGLICAIVGFCLGVVCLFFEGGLKSQRQCVSQSKVWRIMFLFKFGVLKLKSPQVQKCCCLRTCVLSLNKVLADKDL